MKIQVWDIPTRLIHWFLVACFAVAYFTSQSEWLLDYHTIAGYSALALVLIRIVWGFEGGLHSRFSDFVKGWGEVRSYLAKALRLSPPRTIGHNPAVGLVIVFMLTLILAITLTGVVTYSGEEARGALAGAFSYSTAEWAKDIHSTLAWAALAVIALHVMAALVHDFILKENLILSMITGTKEDDGSWAERVSHLGPVSSAGKVRLALWLLFVVAVCLGIVYLPPGPGSSLVEYRRYAAVEEGDTAVRVPVNEQWRTECSACHGLFHPTLLPAKSWERIMSGLVNHFGDDASLDPETRASIESYLTTWSAERSTSEASRKILASIPSGTVPLTITGTRYWKFKHSEISGDVWKRKSVMSKGNCVACHPYAAAGSFEDDDISVPEK